jgi:hypothetical protein
MGARQGHYCVPVAAAMIAKCDGRPVDEVSFVAPRLPVKPMPIVDILNSMLFDLLVSQEFPHA